MRPPLSAVFPLVLLGACAQMPASPAPREAGTYRGYFSAAVNGRVLREHASDEFPDLERCMSAGHAFHFAHMNSGYYRDKGGQTQVECGRGRTVNWARYEVDVSGSSGVRITGKTDLSRQPGDIVLPSSRTVIVPR